MTAFTVIAEAEDGKLDTLLLTENGEEANLKFRELLQTHADHTHKEIWLVNTRTHLRHRRFRRTPEVGAAPTKKPTKKASGRAKATVAEKDEKDGAG